MPSVATMTGSLRIHNIYIAKLKAKQGQLFDSDPELAMLLDNVAAVLSEHAVVLADDIADGKVTTLRYEAATSAR
ncbi:hypothetical protein HLI03_31575 [Rhizobium laguerreae]|uniref:hypothetical protein n=1 Tax=Rhizobium laguerreae TaxID=1076926 RepID=UPI001478BA73|nr:hypothetical protein [Rhizobium laguerreae]NNH46138.1 hypothetical protein [Rhizobium laguerreae]